MVFSSRLRAAGFLACAINLKYVPLSPSVAYRTETSQLSDNKDADTALALRSFREGDTVKAFISSVDLDRRRISFSLKPSHFTDEEFRQVDHDSEEDQGALGVVGDVEMASAEEDGVDDTDGDAASEDEEDQDSEIELMAVDIDPDLNQRQVDMTAVSNGTRPAPTLKIQGGFQWSGDIPQEDADDPGFSEESETDEQPTTKKRKKKKQVELDLTADMHTKIPESTNDFERVLLGSPNSSYLWIQYMSFQLQLAEIEKAREVAKRALDTINFREEREKLNVWIALMNLENVYGTDESLEGVFRDAARHCEPKTVHLRLASILEESGKHEVRLSILFFSFFSFFLFSVPLSLGRIGQTFRSSHYMQKAEEQYKRTCKKFGQSSKVWTLFGEHYLKREDVEQARKLLPRSLQSLEKRKRERQLSFVLTCSYADARVDRPDLKTISKFAQLEYKLGEPERGKTLFEGMVDSHPKRWDLWSIYIDMEAGQKDIQSMRSVGRSFPDRD
jgi:rRNA biogenesis protein RRP5